MSFEPVDFLQELEKGLNMKTCIGCSILIQNENHHVLIARRSRLKRAYPLLWETVGGALETGETPEQCIRREVHEEINCDIQKLKLFQVYIIEKTERYVLIVYTGKIDSEVRLNSEIEQGRWIDKSQIEDFDFYGNEKQKLSDYFRDYFEENS